MRPAAEQTYETEGVKAVRSLGKDEKRQITGMVSSASSGSMLPLQLIFQGKTTAVVPNHVETREAVRKGWDLTNSENHWSNQTTMKQFVEKVLDLWRVKKCKELGAGFFQAEDGVAHRLLESSHVKGVPKLA